MKVLHLSALCLVVYCSATNEATSKNDLNIMHNNSMIARSSDHHRIRGKAKTAACKQYAKEQHTGLDSGSAEIGLNCDFKGRIDKFKRFPFICESYCATIVNS